MLNTAECDLDSTTAWVHLSVLRDLIFV